MNIEEYEFSIIEDINRLSRCNETLAKLCILYYNTVPLILDIQRERRGRKPISKIPMKFIQETLRITRKRAYTYSLAIKIINDCNSLKEILYRETLKKLKDNLGRLTTQNNSQYKGEVV